MDNKNSIGIENNAGFFLQVCNLLNNSFLEIKNDYADYPHSEISYFEKVLKNKSIEIRFDEIEITITCSFNPDELCDCIFLYPDKSETSNELIAYLRKRYEYDYIHAKWIAPDYSIKLQKVVLSIDDLCFMITA